MAYINQVSFVFISSGGRVKVKLKRSEERAPGRVMRIDHRAAARVLQLSPPTVS